ncbi:acyl CoA:acetate/3-ketoacid CoA transferase subunit beta [Alteribacter lacisalsi]|uniref:Acyl CoA:acetate/3-ketoacid CoA transferase subunit beta n=2 Tax=Alteribacter lacisalsi TaxID=2045244 RepID=A0A2W0HBB4_9BACI|nr:acyl CoA:acetate/3-ketoacid CoA transferase subunit beta [Alteribacter lacisalsi]
MGKEIRHQMARRAAREIHAGMVVNLGIGIPTLVADYVPDTTPVMFHAENGVLGTGPSPVQGQENPFLCNAGGFPITASKGASYFDSAAAFAIIRRGKLDMTIMGALQVSENGDLANWIVPGKRVPGMGGAIELAEKAGKVIILMNHVDKEGNPKILKKCTLPLTAAGCVNLIITDMAVLEVKTEGLFLKEVFPPYTIRDVQERTEPKLVLEDAVSGT